jgi:DNA mismatch repair protein MutS
MYEEYGKFYREYVAKYGSRTAIFLMVGTFYELYDIQDKVTGETAFNIKDVADLLGISITVKKDVPSSPNSQVTTKVFTDAIGLFGGIPDYTLHKHAGRLTASGWTVVVIDQVKNAQGKVLDRKVSRILSPSTHVEAMASTETPYLTLLVFQPDLQFGLATLDLTTGSTSTYSSQGIGHTDMWTAEDLQQHLCLYPPKELLVFSSQKAPLEEAFLRRQLSISAATPVHCRTYTTFGTFTNPMANADYLRTLYGIQSLLPVREFLSLRTDLEEIALLYLLQFAEEHMPSALKGFQRNTPWSPEQTLVCGNKAIQQLQMDAVVTLFSSCVTPMGKRDIKQRLLRPLTQVAVLENRFQELKEYLAWAPEQAAALDKNMRFIGDLPRLHRKLLLASVTNQDFVTLGQSYTSLQTILSTWPKAANSFKPPPRLSEDLKTYVDTFTKHIDLDKALKACGSEDISPFANSYEAVVMVEQAIDTLLNELEALRSGLCQTANLSTEAIRLEAREKEPFGLKGSSNTLKALQSVITKLPKGTQIQALKSGGWIDTPALHTLNMRLLKQRELLANRSREILLIACSAISQEAPFWSSMEEWISHVDCSRTIAKVCVEKGFVCPELDSSEGDAFVELKGLRHPLVTNTRVAYVQHDVCLGPESWLVYGMNASGKSTLMKATGIAVLLAQSGCFVPAQSMRLRPFQSVYTRILNHDNLMAGMSSFATEMSELRDILRAANAQTLVLGDELCSGTESVSAMALVAAGIQWLTAKRAKFIFATHLHDLPTLLDTEVLQLKVWHLHVEYDPLRHKLIYDRTLLPGSGSTLYGLEVARALDLPLEFLEQAQVYRRTLLKTTNQQDAATSSHNSVICRIKCELCSSGITSDLEVHHIQQQAIAVKGILPNGVPMNDPTNLITLCAKCHDEIHAGTKEVLPLIQTSTGPERAASVASKTTATTKTRTSKWSEEELGYIRTVLDEYKKASLKNLSYRLKTEYQIEISAQSLAAFRRQ